jgi:uncharacterized protein DUF1844
MAPTEESEDKGRGFKVQDRRRFSPEGEARPGAEASEQNSGTASGQPSAAGSHPSAASHTAQAGPQPQRPAGGPETELTFAAFIWSLSEQALAALGEMPDPATGTVNRDLTMAQQMIDIIRMLRDKTRGNLDRHEQELVAEILSTLQMKYVELAGPPAR